MHSETFVFTDEAGLHTRPAASLVQLARTLKAEILLQRAGKSAPATNLIKLMGLGIVQGDEVTILAEGEDAADAVRQVRELFGVTHG
ncbi:phosphotransferase system HPr (HPr) family protein [Silvimonas terrae]|uniref:Phosphocarrier protein HPr n=1 Tax=Silvimonas terrae TaxID=300266 RepID=A0A840RI43_9NEIS|nr:HPr family phosphocarrier protein [Silvimonas terrae]MBB5191996.1 phosphotransferase system HPr (HPr) family protein [Silvimonas terrae]